MYLRAYFFALGEGCQCVNEQSIRSLHVNNELRKGFFSKSHQSTILVVVHAIKCTTHTHEVGFYEYIW